MVSLSAIICTHNPNRTNLYCVIEALKQQTLTKDQWEFLLIDNCSTEILREQIDISWHINGRVVREDNLGLTPARLRGIEESQAPILVFIDDDNVLANNYLETVLSIERRWNQLGAWSGRVVPKYEETPARELASIIWSLCIREIDHDSWSNKGDFDSTPWGAGMCVRRQVAERYLQQTQQDPLRKSLDRCGNNLGSTGDIDLALTSLDLGMGTGVFKDLELTHIIPRNRVQLDYLLRLIEQSVASYHVYLYVSGQKITERESRIDYLVNRYKELRGSRIQRRIAIARRKGLEQARRLIALSEMSRLDLVPSSIA